MLAASPGPLVIDSNDEYVYALDAVGTIYVVNVKDPKNAFLEDVFSLGLMGF
jgi:hypothetical protein